MSNFSFSKPDGFFFKHRNIGIEAYPDVQSLDITGLFEFFSFASCNLKMLGFVEFE